jgi:UDP-N-acetylglucosamine 2-epimerase (non-hydrolysing)
VGNIMIDTLESNRETASLLKLRSIFEKNMAEGCVLNGSNPTDGSYAVMTLHRPSNVDTREVFEPLINFLLGEVTNDHPLIWPIHPRARKQLIDFGLWERVKNNPGVVLLAPLGYHEMLRLNMGARIMLTDSGGLQEECCVLGTPCLTLRWNTERPITLRENGGASVLVGNNVERIRKEYSDILSLARKPKRPELWDGHTAERCLEAILNS